jgi:hypothetical protein
VNDQLPYPLRFGVDYPDHPLNRLTTFFRPFVALPILVVIASVSGASFTTGGSSGTTTTAAAAGGLLVLGPLLMIVFRRKYPRWWFDFNRELLRFQNRVGAYFLLMEDSYPSTDEAQYVRLDLDYPDAERDLNRWLPLVKWLLAIPHYIVLFFLWTGVFFVSIAAWFAILFTGHYPRGLFGYVEGVMRWNNRVTAYVALLATDRYPPFSLAGDEVPPPPPPPAAPAAPVV